MSSCPRRSSTRRFARGEIDFSLHFAAPLVIPLDAGEPITVLAGVHPGCFEVFGNEHVRSVTDLKGKRVGVQALGSSPHVFLASIAAYIGLDPAQDIDWVTTAPASPWISSPRARSTPSLDCPLSPRSCALEASGT